MGFKVEIRKNCKICGEPLGHRQRTFCSAKCRNRSYAIKSVESGYGKEWQRKRNDALASKPSKRKVQCLICGGWYVQLGSHVVQRHGYETCRQYREEMKLEVKRGIVPDWYRKLKGDIALDNETFKNLKVGKKYWFKKGDPIAGKYERSPVTMERLRNNNFVKYARRAKSINTVYGSNGHNDKKIF